MYTGTAGSCEFRAFPCIAKTRADAAHVLPGAFPKGDALRDRGRHGAGECGCVVEQRIIPGGHSWVNAHCQVSQPASLADDPPADVLDDVGNVGSAGRLDLEKAGLAALVSDDRQRRPSRTMHVIMEIRSWSAAAESLEKRSPIPVGTLLPFDAAFDRLVDVILARWWCG